MAEVRPFRAYRYDPAVAGDYSDLVTPPFDVIRPETRAELAARSPYNFCHLHLPEEVDGKSKYEVSAETLADWIAQGVMKQDDEESYYLLEQRFTGLDGTPYTRRAFYGTVKIPEEGDETVLGHERTFEAKFQDRLHLMEATEAQYGAVFLMYADPEGALAGFLGQMNDRPEDIACHTVDGVDVRVWKVAADPAVNAFFQDKTLYIADGHHRFRTAAAYRDACRAAGKGEGRHDYALIGFVEANDPGFVICPAHRLLDPPEGFTVEGLVETLAPWFDVTPAEGDLPALVEAGSGCTIGLKLTDGRQYLFTLKDIDRTNLLGDEHGPAWRDLDVSVLHGGILERGMGLDANAMLVYEHDAAKALDMVDSGEKGMVFVTKGVRPEQLFACADAREFMPQKSTYMFPKLASGAVIHKLT